jgi:putative transposase
MPTPDSTALSTPPRCPGEIISHAVWLSGRFPLSHRDVAELLSVRGIIVSYEAMRQGCRKCGQQSANQLRCRRPRPGAKWHLDAVVVTINKIRPYLGRAVEQDGHGLDRLVQRRRNTQAAQKFVRTLLKGCPYVPRALITDTLQSSGAAPREILPGVEHRQHGSLHNRAENSPQPTRQRERRMQGVQSPGQAHRFLAAYGPIAPHFRPRRHRFSAPASRQEIRERCQSWGEITGTELAA